MKNLQLEQLALEDSNRCITISMNTHRTHPKNAEDLIVLKNLLSEARVTVHTETGKRVDEKLLKNINDVLSEVDFSHNLESLHVFLSNETKIVIRSVWPVPTNTVHVARTFAVKPLIKMLNRSEDYLILELSQGITKLYNAVNNAIVSQVINENFPFTGNDHIVSDMDKTGDSKKADSMIREYFNEVDKAVVAVHNETGKNCVVICTPDNYSKLIPVANKPFIYLGSTHSHQTTSDYHHLALAAWEIMEEKQKVHRNDAMNEVQAAIGINMVLTDLSQIYNAAKEGRGDLLVVSDSFAQVVEISDDNKVTILHQVAHPGTVQDIESTIAWEVIYHGGRVVFVDAGVEMPFGTIALKVRY